MLLGGSSPQPQTGVVPVARFFSRVMKETTYHRCALSTDAETDSRRMEDTTIMVCNIIFTLSKGKQLNFIFRIEFYLGLNKALPVSFHFISSTIFVEEVVEISDRVELKKCQIM